MALGVAGSISIKQISGDFIQHETNNWLEDNADCEIIDIKFSASATNEDWGTDIIIVYRKEKPTDGNQ